jgi:DNA-binding NtrC family response regulator
MVRWIFVSEESSMFKILLVDHQTNTRESYRVGLEGAGFAVATASGGVEAIRLLREWNPDLAVLDVRLGDESGLDLLRHMLEIRPSLSTILMSAFPGYRDDFASWLADAFIDKAPDATYLTSKVRELLAPVA